MTYDHLSPDEIARKTIDRQRLRELIGAWIDGTVDNWFVVNQAEGYMDDLGEIPSPEAGDPEFAPIVVVVDLLSIAPHQWLLPADGPALLAFLDAAPDDHTAHDRLDEYLLAICTPEREAEVHRAYYHP